MPDTHAPPPSPPLSQTEELVALARAGHLLISKDGTVTNPRNGVVYGANRALKGRYYVLGGTCPVRNRRFTANLHRVIWVYFRGPIPEGMQVNHKDGDTKNNAIANLELATPSENTRHAVANGSMQQKLGMAGATRIRELFLSERLHSKSAIALAFGVDVNMVTRILRNASYPSEDDAAVRAAQAHEARYPPRERTSREEAGVVGRRKLERILDLITAGEIEVDAEKPEFRGVTVCVKTYAPSKSLKYTQVHVRLGPGDYYLVPAHRLMWAAFHGVPPPEMVVHHKNADKSDFALVNLELTTTRKNALYAAAAGTHEHSKVDEELATHVRRSFLACPRSANKLCREFGISQRTARTLLANQSHQYGPGELREQARAAYEAKTAEWRAGGRKAGTVRPRSEPRRNVRLRTCTA